MLASIIMYHGNASLNLGALFMKLRLRLCILKLRKGARDNGMPIIELFGRLKASGLFGGVKHGHKAKLYAHHFLDDI